jgi:hypothetical protein
MIKIAEVIRRRMGWCPNMDMASGREQTRTSEKSFLTAPGNALRVQRKGVVDYGTTGIPIPLFIVAIVGVVFTFTILRLVNPFIAGLLLSIFLLAVAAMMVYLDRNGNTVDVTPDAIFIHRPLFKPRVIVKDVIRKTEVRNNKLPVPLSVFAAVILVIIVFSTVRIYRELLPFVYGVTPGLVSLSWVAFYISIIIFSVCTFHRSYVRSRYPQVMVVTTKTRKIIVMYVDDPHAFAETLEVS